MNITIIDVNPDDWQKFRDIRLRILETDPAAFGRSYKEDSERTEQEWRDLVEKRQLFFALKDDKIVGTVGIRREKGDMIEHMATLVSLGVDASHRGQGIATALMGHTIEVLKKDPKIIKVRLSVNEPQVTAIKLYEKLGFKRVGYGQYEIKIGDKFLNQIQMEMIFEDKIK